MPNPIEEVKDPGEELITPDNVDDKLGIETPDDEKETPTPSSGEDKPDDEESEEDPAQPDGEEGDTTDDEGADEPDNGEPASGEQQTPEEDGKKEPKEVPGETPREKALRLETTRVKKLLRQERGKKLLSDAQPQQVPGTELSEADKQVLESFDPDQLSNLEKAFTVLAKKNGYVRKDEFTKQTYTETAQTILDEFLEEHEEYSVEKDPDGVLWNRFKELYDDYKKPQNPKEFRRIFNKVHNEIFGITTTPSQTPQQIKAKQEKVKTASHGSNTAAPTRQTPQQPAPKTNELSKVARGGGLVGFSEQELAEMGL